jgi:hypothetical protein
MIDTTGNGSFFSPVPTSWTPGRVSVPREGLVMRRVKAAAAVLPDPASPSKGLYRIAAENHSNITARQDAEADPAEARQVASARVLAAGRGIGLRLIS